MKKGKPPVKVLPPWGLALERLREKSGLDYDDMVRAGFTTSGEYYRITRSKTGPGVQTLHSLLKGFGCTWSDWAREFEAALKIAPITIRTKGTAEKAAKGGHEKLSVG